MRLFVCLFVFPTGSLFFLKLYNCYQIILTKSALEFQQRPLGGSMRLLVILVPPALSVEELTCKPCNLTNQLWVSSGVTQNTKLGHSEGKKQKQKQCQASQIFTPDTKKFNKLAKQKITSYGEKTKHLLVAASSFNNWLW